VAGKDVLLSISVSGGDQPTSLAIAEPRMVCIGLLTVGIAGGRSSAGRMPERSWSK
jgi:hypothetical protein